MRLSVAVVSFFLFLTLLTQKSESNPVAVIKGAVSALMPFVNGFIANLQAKREAEKIKIRVWMHRGDTKLNGCGFYVRVDGYAGGKAEDLFPKYTDHKCPGGKYRMRMTSPAAMYDKTLHLGNQMARSFEIHADGWHNTFLHTICIGFNERTIPGGPRAFCLNNELLKGCGNLRNKYHDVNLNFNDVMLTRSVRGTHKIIFRELDVLVGGFESIQRNTNDQNAMRTVCDRIDLVKGTFRDSYWDCPAEKVTTRSSGSGMFYSWRDELKKEDKNPYGCDRYEHT